VREVSGGGNGNKKYVNQYSFAGLFQRKYESTKKHGGQTIRFSSTPCCNLPNRQRVDRVRAAQHQAPAKIAAAVGDPSTADISSRPDKGCPPPFSAAPSAAAPPRGVSPPRWGPR